jgi:hypothetical protein
MLRLVARSGIRLESTDGSRLALLCSTRHLRRRGSSSTSGASTLSGDGDGTVPAYPPTRKPVFAESEMRAAPSLTSGLRSGSFASSPASSLDSVRREIEAMNTEARRAEFRRQLGLQRAREQQREAQQQAPGGGGAPVPGEAEGELLSPLLPGLGFDPKQAKVVESTRCRDMLIYNRLLQDAKEVLRRRKEHDIVRLMHHAIPEVANSLLARHRGTAAERSSPHKSPTTSKQLDSSDNQRTAGSVLPTSEGVRKALYRLRALLVEAEAALGDDIGDDDESSAALATAIDGLTDAELSLLLRAGILDPLALGAGDISFDPAKEREADVIKEEVEPKKEDNVTHEDDEDDNSQAMMLVDSPRRLAEVIEAVEAAEPLVTALADDLAGHTTEDVAAPLIKARRGLYGQVSESELLALEAQEKLDRDTVTDATMSPNTFLRALAHTDVKIRQSLDVLDRARRAAVLDSKFQESVDYVNHRAKERFVAASGLRVKMRRKAAEVPLFFASARSRPPPAADMNLPMPKPSAEERKRIRKARRAASRGKAFRR